MKYRILSQTDKEMFGANIAVMLDYTDVVTLGAVASGTIQVAPLSGNLAVGTKVQLVGMVLNTPFAGSDSPTTYAWQLGDSGSAARYLASTESIGTGSYVSYAPGTGTSYCVTTAAPVIATVTDTAKSCANATAGQITFYLRVDDMTQWATPGQ